jgi:hypothetical protein
VEEGNAKLAWCAISYAILTSDTHVGALEICAHQYLRGGDQEVPGLRTRPALCASLAIWRRERRAYSLATSHSGGRADHLCYGRFTRAQTSSIGPTRAATASSSPCCRAARHVWPVSADICAAYGAVLLWCCGARV